MGSAALGMASTVLIFIWGPQPVFTKAATARVLITQDDLLMAFALED